MYVRIMQSENEIGRRVSIRSLALATRPTGGVTRLVAGSRCATGLRQAQGPALTARPTVMETHSNMGSSCRDAAPTDGAEPQIGARRSRYAARCASGYSTSGMGMTASDRRDRTADRVTRSRYTARCASSYSTTETSEPGRVAREQLLDHRDGGRSRRCRQTPCIVTRV
jgi:hypothetical protein